MTKRAGYSLIEVIVAFAVMSAVLAVLIPGQAALLGRVGATSERVLAQDYALSLLEEASVLRTSSASMVRPFRDWDIALSSLEDVTELGLNRLEFRVEIRAANGAELANESRWIVVLDAP